MKIRVNSISSDDYPYAKIVYVEDQYVFVTGSCFSNCQNWTIGEFRHLIGVAERTKKSLEEIILEIRHAADFTDRNLLVLDIKRFLFNQIKDALRIYQYMEYRNLTGTQMVMCMIDLRGNND